MMKSVVLVLVAVLVCVHASDVVVLTEDNFDELTSSGIWLLEFYAPWCGHCKKLAPIYEELATAVKGQYNIGKIDCTVEKELQARYGIRGYPTIKMLKDNTIYDYNSQRTLDAFVSFLGGGYSSAQSGPVPAAGPKTPKAPAAAEPPKTPAAAEQATASTTTTTSDVVVLTDANFDQHTSKDTWFLEFYAPWCGHCKKLAPIYEQVGSDLKGKVNVGKVDCTVEKAVCAQYDIQGYPTVYYKRDNELREYNGGRTLADFKKYADGGWKAVTPTSIPEPISGWKAQMYALLGQLEQGLSMNVWLILGLCIAVGVLLGICVVLISPSPAPNKTIHYTPKATSSTTDEITEEEEVSKND